MRFNLAHPAPSVSLQDDKLCLSLPGITVTYGRLVHTWWLHLLINTMSDQRPGPVRTWTAERRQTGKPSRFELCLQLTAGSRPVNGDEHRALKSQSCERALLTMGDFTFFTSPLANNDRLQCGRRDHAWPP